MKKMTPSQRRKANTSIANYMLSNGYNETLECFKREADVPDEEEEEPEEVRIQVENDKNARPDHSTFHTPLFILNISVWQCSFFLTGMSKELLLLDPYR